VKLKLKKSEVLLLTQVLFNVKCTFTDNFFLDFGGQIDELHDKLCAHLLNNKSRVAKKSKTNSECVIHHGDGIFEIMEPAREDSVENEGDVEKNFENVSIESLVLLESIKIVHEDEKKNFQFEFGTSKSMLDVNLNGGEEILCDVTSIERRLNTFIIECVTGLVEFEVKKLPNSWTSLLKEGTTYRIST
jgi:hypothetical protein